MAKLKADNRRLEGKRTRFTNCVEMVEKLQAEVSRLTRSKMDSTGVPSARHNPLSITKTTEETGISKRKAATGNSQFNLTSQSTHTMDHIN